MTSSKLLICARSLVLSVFCLPSVMAATITITGPSGACPGYTYSYTASASNALGSQKGNFRWTFYQNGVSLGVIGVLNALTVAQVQLALYHLPGQVRLAQDRLKLILYLETIQCAR